MLEQQTETLEESWNNVLNVFYTYHGSRNPELRSDAATIHEVTSATSEVSDEFIRRFVSHDAWNLEEKVYLATAALEEFPGKLHLNLCARMLDSCIPVPKYFNTLFYCLVRFIFVHGKNIEGHDDDTFKQEQLWPRYNAFLDTHFSGFEFSAQEPTKNPEKRAAVVVPQVLGLGHSTTRIALEYARALAHGGKRSVLLANTELFPQQNEAPVNNAFIANRMPDSPDSISRLDYEGSGFIYWRANEIAFSVSKIKKAILTVDAYCPSVVFAQGDWNMVADVLARKYPVVHVPSLRGAAMGHAHAYLYPEREVSADSYSPMANQRGEYHGYTYMPIVPTASVDVPARATGIPKDALVFAVVGSRLPDELDASFAQVVEAILKSNKKAHVAIVCPDYDRQLNSVLSKKLARRVHTFDWQDDLGAFYRTCDVYLNPFRQGGGISAYLAMREGLPVLSLGDCDLENYLGRELCVSDKATYEERALSLANDSQAREALAGSIRDRVAQIPTLSEVPETLDAVVEHAQEVFGKQNA
jgi:hypothetical protein